MIICQNVVPVSNVVDNLCWFYLLLLLLFMFVFMFLGIFGFFLLLLSLYFTLCGQKGGLTVSG